MAYDVFISYRRQGGGADARMMYDRLLNEGYTVSFDMDTLKNGNFNEELLKRVAECKNFVVLLSENCFERTLNGCKREDDWLRIEIATALYNNKNIVTVMLPGFTFPAKLPPDIDAIRNKNGPKYDLYYIDGFYDKLKKDFLVKEVSEESTAVSNLEVVFSKPDEISDAEQVDILDAIGDDTDFLKEEAEKRYSVISRVLPYTELENIDKTWNDAGTKKDEGDYKAAGELYLKVMDLCAKATPCSSGFVMRMTADEIDTRRRDWFEKALSRAQSGDVDYEYGVGSVYAGGLGVPRDPAAAFRWFERAAKHGNAPAMAAVGAAYAGGTGVEADYAAAKEWLTKAAAEGLPAAEERLGYLYQNGFGVEQDYGAAKEWYEKAATLGNSASRTALGLMYKDGLGVDKDEQRAMVWFREASADEHPVALRILAEMLFASRDESKYEEALGYCRRAVNAGDIDAICLLGQAYENGWGIEKDVAKASELYLKGKELGCGKAETCIDNMKPAVQYALGIKYMEGRAIPRDFAKAREWLSKASEQNMTEAIAWYAYLLENGFGGDVDNKTALSLYEKAASAGSVVAAAELGNFYRTGTCVAEDKKRGFEIFKKALVHWKEVPEECRWLAVRIFSRLALMLKKGEACDKDPFAAARLYRFAAKAGDLTACRNLAICYRDGIGVAKSDVEMDKWFAEMWRLSREALNPLDGTAMCALGEACQSGQGTGRDLKAASEWWHKGLALSNFNCAVHLSNAGRQHPEILADGDTEAILNQYKKEAMGGGRVAMHNLGVRYRNGRGVAADSHEAVQWYLKAAESGYTNSMNALAEMYENGDGVEQNREEGLKWILKAAEADNPTAQRKLSDRYLGGTSLGRDFSKCVEWLEKAVKIEPEDVYAVRRLAKCYRDGIGVAENGGRAKDLFSSVIGKISRLAEDRKAGSQDDLANCYYRGEGVPLDLLRARELYEKAADGKDEHAMDSLMRFYRFGIGCDVDFSLSERRSREFLHEKMKDGGDASRGMPESCLSVGNYYRSGYGVPEDYATAYVWYQNAAEKKSWKAMLKLASMSAEGEGGVADQEVARSWAEKAVAELTPLAENGSAEAQRGLGDCYAKGWGVEKSDETAVKWYLEAYEGRDWLAAARLARCYALGTGVDQDCAKARELLGKAAERYSGVALNYLGESCENGELAFEKDDAKAFDFYRRSAAEGNAGGLFNVGRCYRDGIGVESDNAKAVLWLKLAAAEKGDFYGYDKKAAEMLKEIDHA